MKPKRQHQEPWLDGVVRRLELLCQQAAASGDEYEAPTPQTVMAAKELLKEFHKAETPQIMVTQDGEVVVTWTNFDDKFRAIVRTDGQIALFENKKKVDHASFARRLVAVPA